MENLHPITAKIINSLEENNCRFETFEHEPVRTSEEAARVRTGYSLEQGAKAMLVKAKTKDSSEYLMLVLPGGARFDSKKVKRLLQAKDVSLVSENEVLEITNGIEPGGVPPFGNLFRLQVIADPQLFDNEKIIFNAGSKSFSIAMGSADYKKVVNPKLESIIKD